MSNKFQDAYLVAKNAIDAACIIHREAVDISIDTYHPSEQLDAANVAYIAAIHDAIDTYQSFALGLYYDKQTQLIHGI